MSSSRFRRTRVLHPCVRLGRVFGSRRRVPSRPSLDVSPSANLASHLKRNSCFQATATRQTTPSPRVCALPFGLCFLRTRANSRLRGWRRPIIGAAATNTQSCSFLRPLTRLRKGSSCQSSGHPLLLTTAAGHWFPACYFPTKHPPWARMHRGRPLLHLHFSPPS